MPRKGILKRFIVFSRFLSLRKMKDCLPQNATLPFSVLEKILKWRKRKGGGGERRGWAFTLLFGGGKSICRLTLTVFYVSFPISK